MRRRLDAKHCRAAASLTAAPTAVASAPRHPQRVTPCPSARVPHPLCSQVVVVAGEVIRRYASGNVTEEQEPQERHPLGEAGLRADRGGATSWGSHLVWASRHRLDLDTLRGSLLGPAALHHAPLRSPWPARRAGELPFESNNCGYATDEAFIELLAHAAASANGGAGPGSPRKGGKAAAGGKRGGKVGGATVGGAMMEAVEMKRLQLAPDDVAKVTKRQACDACAWV